MLASHWMAAIAAAASRQSVHLRGGSASCLLAWSRESDTAWAVCMQGQRCAGEAGAGARAGHHAVCRPRPAVAARPRHTAPGPAARQRCVSHPKSCDSHHSLEPRSTATRVDSQMASRGLCSLSICCCSQHSTSGSLVAVPSQACISQQPCHAVQCCWGRGRRCGWRTRGWRASCTMTTWPPSPASGPTPGRWGPRAHLALSLRRHCLPLCLQSLQSVQYRVALLGACFPGRLDT